MTREEELALLIEEQRKDDTHIQQLEVHPGVHSYVRIPLDAEMNAGDHNGGVPAMRGDYLVGMVYDFDSMIESGDYEAQGQIESFLSPRPDRGHSLRPIKHGTRDGYTNRGCRCQPCRDAFAAAMREYTHRTGRRRPIEQYLAERRARAAAKPHGTTSKYRDGCRCEECKSAGTAAKKAWRERKSLAA